MLYTSVVESFLKLFLYFDVPNAIVHRSLYDLNDFAIFIEFPWICT